jgi:hypothetical protein
MSEQPIPPEGNGETGGEAKTEMDAEADASTPASRMVVPNEAWSDNPRGGMVVAFYIIIASFLTLLLFGFLLIRLLQ